jgi:tripartite-type tricarboxylate transporter receptor subunit TctC
MRFPMVLIAIHLGLAAALTPAAAQDVAEFYRGKTIRLIVGAAAGGGYDIPARAIAGHMGRHIPGNPAIVVENMPGATSLIMTNYLYARAPRDGTAIGMPNNNVPLEPRLQILSREGGNVSFDITKFGWIGSPVQEPQILFTLASAARSVDDLKAGKVLVGSTGRSADNFSLPFMLNQLLGTKMDIIPGYQGQNDIFLAIDRGEVQGNNTGLTNLLVTKPDWIRNGRVKILVQYGSERAAAIPDVPTALELAPDESARELIRFFGLKFQMARPIAVPPDVPSGRLRALQDAFDATMKDPAFLSEAQKIGLEISPVSGIEVARLVAEMQTTPQTVVDRLKNLLSLESSK